MLDVVTCPMDVNAAQIQQAIEINDFSNVLFMNDNLVNE
jgi:hypothetical protein